MVNPNLQQAQQERDKLLADLNKLTTIASNIRIQADSARNIFIQDREQKRAFGSRERELVTFREFMRAEERRKVSKKQISGVKKQLESKKAEIARLRGKLTKQERIRANAQNKIILQQQLLNEGEITKIDYAKNSVTVNGQNIKVSPSTLNNVQLSAVKRAKEKQKLDLETKRKITPQLTKEELKTALNVQRNLFDLKKQKQEQTLNVQKSIFDLKKIENNPKTNQLIKVKEGKITVEAVKEFFPFVNKNSQSGYKKIFTGDFKLNKAEIANVVFDTLTILASIKPKKKPSKIIESNVKARVGIVAIKSVFKVLKKQPTLIFKGLVNTFTTIGRDVGVASRAYNSAQEYYQVDNKLLKKVIQNTELKNVLDNKGNKFYKTENDLYQDYIGTINKQTKFFDKNINVEDYTKLIGLDFATEKKIIQGQKEFKKELINNGLNTKLATKIISELENKRKARLFGQVVGAIKTEYSSEKLAQQLLKKGATKKIAVGIGGAREGLSILAQEGFIQEGDINAFDITMAVFFGASGCIYFSKSVSKKLKDKELE